MALTHQLTNLQSNYTEDAMIITGNVNYATLNFESLGLSSGSDVTVYFVPVGLKAELTDAAAFQFVTDYIK